MILGLDVSSVATGWAIIDSNNRLDYGVIKPPKKMSYENRLVYIYEELSHLLVYTNGVKEAYIESVFTCKNANTTIKLAQVRGTAILACKIARMNIHDVAPVEVKKHLGNAKADKAYILNEINTIYRLSLNDDNIADAIAIARYGLWKQKES